MRRIALLSLCAFLLLAVSLAFGRDDHMVNSALVPAAQGTVHTDTDRNGNTGVEVKVQHLAKPHDLQGGYDTYVVWVQPRGQSPQNVGELRVNNGLEGSLRTDTPAKTFDLFITAEQNARAEAPSGPEIMHAAIARD